MPRNKKKNEQVNKTIIQSRYKVNTYEFMMKLMSFIERLLKKRGMKDIK